MLTVTIVEMLIIALSIGTIIAFASGTEKSDIVGKKFAIGAVALVLLNLFWKLTEQATVYFGTELVLLG